MNDIKQAVKEALAEALPHLDLSPEEHAAQHAFLQAWMLKEQRKAERYEYIKRTVGGWIIIAVLGGIGTGAYKLGVWIFQHVRVGS